MSVNRYDSQSKKLIPIAGGVPTATGNTPIGTIITIMGTNPPTHYLLCDGTVYPIAKYQGLATYFTNQFGSANVFGGDGTTTFAVPDMQSGDGATPIMMFTPSNVSPIFCIAYEDIVIGETVFNYTLNTPQVLGSWEDGSPLYQITITGTTINDVLGAIPTGLTGISYAELVRFQVSNGSYVKNMLESVSIKEDGTEIAMVANSDSLFKNKTFYATINYKKATS